MARYHPSARRWRLPRMLLRIGIVGGTLLALAFIARTALSYFLDMNQVAVTGDAGADPAKVRIEWRGEREGARVIFDGIPAEKVPEVSGANRFTIYYAGRKLGELAHVKRSARDDNIYLFRMHGPADAMSCELDVVMPDGSRESHQLRPKPAG